MMVNEVPSSAADVEISETVSALFGRGSLYVAVWAFQPAAAVLSTPVVTRLLGARSFGTAAASIVLMPVLAAVVTFGLDFATQRFYVEDGGPDAARELLAVALLLVTSAALILIATASAWSGLLGFSAGMLRLTIAWAGLAAFNRVQLALLRAQDRLGPFAATSCIQALGTQLCGVAMVLAQGATARSYVLGLAIGQAAAVCVGLAFVTPRLRGVRRLRRSTAALRYGVPLVPHTLAAFLLNASGRLIIFNDLGQSAMARYQVTYNAACMLVMLLGAVDLSWEPRLFAIRDDQVRWRVLAHLRDGVFRLLLPLCLAMTLAAPVVLRFYVPVSYRAYKLTDVVAIIALAAVPFAGYCANMRVLLWFKQTSALAAASASAALACLLLNLVLVPSIGITGSALATLVAYGVLWWGSARVARKRTQLPGPDSATAITILFTALGAAGAVAVPTFGLWLALRAALGAGFGVWGAVRLLRLRRGGVLSAESATPTENTRMPGDEAPIRWSSGLARRTS
ncbi:MAG TPA: polysaccharide biosynthesis C-terminal domain-containing protein [Mycobacteriales bacterium]|nr:polysaccharide biosynthesis C-terminal domain-containing protein [Mycobacteriales bacterium]